MLDSTTPATSIPDNEDRVALYYNGHVGALGGIIPAGKNWRRAYWIDVLAENPEECSILDIETGDAIPSDILRWVPHRLTVHPGALCRLYSNLSSFRSVQFYVSQLHPVFRKQVRFWIADPTMQEHQVPGASATQWYWGNLDTVPVNYDRSLVSASWDG